MKKIFIIIIFGLMTGLLIFRTYDFYFVDHYDVDGTGRTWAYKKAYYDWRELEISKRCSDFYWKTVAKLPVDCLNYFTNFRPN